MAYTKKLSPRLDRWDTASYRNMARNPGVYMLIRNEEGEVGFVGRSDTDVISQIKHIHMPHEDGRRPYLFVRYRNCTSVEEAYEWECKYWHKEEPSANSEVHPLTPDGEGASCPVCGG